MQFFFSGLWKSALVSALPLFFICSCQRSSPWAYQEEPRRGISAAELSYESPLKFRGMRIQFLKTPDVVSSRLSLFGGRFAVDEDRNISVTIVTRSGKESVLAHCLDGDQRCLLPEGITEQILSELSLGNDVVLYTKRHRLALKPDQFSKLYKKFAKR